MYRVRGYFFLRIDHSFISQYFHQSGNDMPNPESMASSNDRIAFPSCIDGCLSVFGHISRDNWAGSHIRPDRAPAGHARQLCKWKPPPPSPSFKASTARTPTEHHRIGYHYPEGEYLEYRCNSAGDYTSASHPTTRSMAKSGTTGASPTCAYQ